MDSKIWEGKILANQDQFVKFANVFHRHTVASPFFDVLIPV